MNITDDTIHRYVEVYFDEQSLKTHESEHVSSLPPIGTWTFPK